MLAAALACGRGAVVSHLSAAALLDLRDQAPVVVDVIACGEAGRTIDGIRRHHVPRPKGGEAGACDGVPCTSPSRTLVDLAGVLGERALRAVTERAAVDGILDLHGIDEILAARRRRGARLLRRILREWQPRETVQSQRKRHPDLRSELEARLLMLLTRADLPAPRCNRPLQAGGKRFVVDFLWPEQRVVVETDGRRFHGHAAAFERDRFRDRTLQAAGYRVVRITYAQIEREAELVAATIRHLLSGDFG